MAVRTEMAVVRVVCVLIFIPYGGYVDASDSLHSPVRKEWLCVTHLALHTREPATDTATEPALIM